MISNKNAKKGAEAEKLFKNSIGKQSQCLSVIQKGLSLSSNNNVSKVYHTGGERGKADVIIDMGDGKVLGVNIKSYKNKDSGFNQAVRMNPHTFIQKFNIPVNVGNIIVDSILRKAKNSRGEPFILPIDSTDIINCFRDKAENIIKYSISGDESIDILVLFNSQEKIINIYLMKDILKAMNRMIQVEITKKGVIKLNKYFTIQKKGGNGEHERHKKTDIKHGGNNLQVKIKTSSIVNDIDPLCSYRV